MTVDHYEVLGLEPGAKAEEIEAAFEQLVIIRKEKRQRTADVFAAYAVLSEPALRAMYDMTRLGQAAHEKLADAKDAVSEILPEVDWAEVRREAKQAALKATVLISGATARAADTTARISRRLQVAAAKRIDRNAPAAPAAMAESPADL